MFLYIESFGTFLVDSITRKKYYQVSLIAASVVLQTKNIDEIMFIIAFFTFCETIQVDAKSATIT
jgi:hypothetical protein